MVAHAYGAETEPIEAALLEVIQYVRSSPRITDVALYLPTKHNLRGTTIASVLGERASKALIKGRRVTIDGAASLRLCTERTIEKSRPPEVVLAIYASDKMLDIVERYGSTKLIVAVPWNIDLVERWFREHCPEEIGKARIPPGD